MEEKNIIVFQLNQVVYILMMHKIVSNSERMESFVVREYMLNDGHRCGACHNVSDAKVRMIKNSRKSR